MMNPALLILDVDESLLFATEAPMRDGHDFECGDYAVFCRPLLDEFLQRVRAHFKLAVWSSASADYVCSSSMTLRQSWCGTTAIWFG